MTETALVVREEMSLADTMILGETLAQSGYFKDTKQAAQAVVKILAGRELGFGPIASMTGVNIIKSQVAVGANLLAAAVKADPRYNYRVVVLDDERCEIAFFQGGQEQGRSVFTAEDAQRAEIGKMVAPGATRSMLGRFPRNMLFSRAMTNGMRWYCPDAAGGAPIYTPEELGVEVDGETGEIIDVTPTPVTVIKPPNGSGNGKQSEPAPASDGIPQNWEQLYKRAQAELEYSHTEHVKNALVQIFGKDFSDQPMAALWQGLIDHQKSKEAEAT